MAMNSLKQDGGEYATCASNNFGYGTEVRLNAEQCEALGISKMLRAGQPVTIRAAGVVTSSTESVEADGDSSGPDVSLCIQLTEMEVKTSGAVNAARAAQLLYGKQE